MLSINPECYKSPTSLDKVILIFFMWGRDVLLLNIKRLVDITDVCMYVYEDIRLHVTLDDPLP